MEELVVSLVIALLHLPSLMKPFLDVDEAVYASIAGLSSADGGRLYAEGGGDNKFPGIFWIYSLVFRVFGLYSMTAVHVLALIVVIATFPKCGRIMAHDFVTTKPAIIVDTAAANSGNFGSYPIRNFTMLRELLDLHYRSERVIDGMVIYRRVD